MVQIELVIENDNGGPVGNIFWGEGDPDWDIGQKNVKIVPKMTEIGKKSAKNFLAGN